MWLPVLNFADDDQVTLCRLLEHTSPRPSSTLTSCHSKFLFIICHMGPSNDHTIGYWNHRGRRSLKNQARSQRGPHGALGLSIRVCQKSERGRISSLALMVVPLEEKRACTNFHLDRTPFRGRATRSKFPLRPCVKSMGLYGRHAQHYLKGYIKSKNGWKCISLGWGRANMPM